MISVYVCSVALLARGPLSMHACTFDTDHNSYNNAEGLINNPGLAFCSRIENHLCQAKPGWSATGGDGR